MSRAQVARDDHQLAVARTVLVACEFHGLRVARDVGQQRRVVDGRWALLSARRRHGRQGAGMGRGALSWRRLGVIALAVLAVHAAAAARPARRGVMRGPAARSRDPRRRCRCARCARRRPHAPMATVAVAPAGGDLPPRRSLPASRPRSRSARRLPALSHRSAAAPQAVRPPAAMAPVAHGGTRADRPSCRRRPGRRGDRRRTGCRLRRAICRSTAPSCRRPSPSPTSSARRAQRQRRAALAPQGEHYRARLAGSAGGTPLLAWTAPAASTPQGSRPRATPTAAAAAARRRRISGAKPGKVTFSGRRSSMRCRPARRIA